MTETVGKHVATPAWRPLLIALALLALLASPSPAPAHNVLVQAQKTAALLEANGWAEYDTLAIDGDADCRVAGQCPAVNADRAGAFAPWAQGRKRIAPTYCKEADRILTYLLDENPPLADKFFMRGKRTQFTNFNALRLLRHAWFWLLGSGRPDVAIAIADRADHRRTVCIEESCYSWVCHFEDGYFDHAFASTSSGPRAAYPMGSSSRPRFDFFREYSPPAAARDLVQDPGLHGFSHTIRPVIATVSSQIEHVTCDVGHAPDDRALATGLAECLIIAAGFVGVPLEGVHYFVNAAGRVRLADGLFSRARLNPRRPPLYRRY